MTKQKNHLSHPGEILKDVYLGDMGIRPGTLARALGVDRAAIAKILKGERDITADMSLRLGLFFGQSDGFWLTLQKRYDLHVAQQEKGAAYRQIVVPYAGTTASIWSTT